MFLLKNRIFPYKKEYRQPAHSINSPIKMKRKTAIIFPNILKFTFQKITTTVKRPRSCIRRIASSFEMYYLGPVYNKPLITGFRHPELPVNLLAIHEKCRIKRPQFVINRPGNKQIGTGNIINLFRLLNRCRIEMVAFFQKPEILTQHFYDLAQRRYKPPIRMYIP